MTIKSPAPASLPQYIVEGVPKQDDESLLVLQDWIDELLSYRQGVATEDIGVDDDESVQAVEESNDGTVVTKRSGVEKITASANVVSFTVHTSTSFVGRVIV